MRILNIAFAFATISNGAVGGAEQVLAQLDRALHLAGHESVVVAAADSKVCGTLFGTSHAPDLITRDYYRQRYCEHSNKIREALQSGPIDLIHMHGLDFHEFLPDVEVPILGTLHLPPHWYPGWIYYIERPHFFLNCVSESQYRAIPEKKLLARTIETEFRFRFATPFRDPGATER